MESASLAGSLLQTFSPTAVAVAYWVWYAPQQILVLLLGALGAILGVGLVGAFYAASNPTPGAAAGFTYLHLVVQESLRILLSLLLAKVEGVFRSKGHSLTASRVGVAATGMAAGFGQGTMHAVLTVGLAASTSAASQFEGVSGYDWARCPHMPHLQYLSLVGLFTILVHVACSIVAILFASTWVGKTSSTTEVTPLTQHGDDAAREVVTAGVRTPMVLLGVSWALRLVFVSMPLANEGSYSLLGGVQATGCETTLPIMGLLAAACCCVATFGVYKSSFAH